MKTLINVADLVDPKDPQGRTYRQVNAELKHIIPLGTLVELKTGERLVVMKYTRDCDQTPLYSIGRRDSITNWIHGFAEEDLKVISLEKT